MLESHSPSSAFAVVCSSLKTARAHVLLGKTRAATADDIYLTHDIHDQCLVAGIADLTQTSERYREPVLYLQRAAWTAERSEHYVSHFNNDDRSRVLMRDVNLVMTLTADPYAYPLSGQLEVDAFTKVAQYLAAHENYNDAIQLLEIAESAQLQNGCDDSLLKKIHKHQQYLITAQMDKIDDRFASRVIEPERLPPRLAKRSAGISHG